MKRFFILILLIFGSLSLFSQVRDIKIKGSIIDFETSVAIPNVNITVVGEQKGVISDSNGKFELQISQLPVQLFFSHISYKIYMLNVEKGNNKNIRIKMEREVEEIDEVVVSGERIQKIRLGDTLNVADYEIVGDRMIVVANPYKHLKGRAIYLTDLEGKQLDVLPFRRTGKEIKIPEIHKPQIIHLYKNFMGGVNLLTRDTVWEVLKDGDSISLRYPMDYKDFLGYLFPVKTKLGRSMFFQLSNFTKNYTFRLSPELNEPQEIKFVYDKYGASRYAQGVIKYVSAPYFVRENQLLVFDFFNNHIEFFNSKGESVDSVPIVFQNRTVQEIMRKPYQDIDQFNFTQKVINDPITGKAYAFFKMRKGGRQSLREIDLETGEITRIIEIPRFPNIEKVQVIDNVVYFMYFVKTYPYYNSIFRMRI